MSEKTDLELQVDPSMHKAALQQNDANSQPAKKKDALRSRLWKTFYIIECHSMAGILHRYAIAHAQKAHLARWDEAMIPDVENLVDWIKLSMSISSNRHFPWMNSTAVFWIAVVNFVIYAWWYFDCNKRTDRFQSWTLASVVAVGFVVAMVPGFGLWISTFCVVPRAVVVGLLVSDFAHWVFPRSRRRTDDAPSIEVGGVMPEKA